MKTELRMPDTNRMCPVFARPAVAITGQALDYEGQPSNVRGAYVPEEVVLDWVEVSIGQVKGADFSVQVIGDTLGTIVTVTVTAGNTEATQTDIGAIVPQDERLSVVVSAGSGLKPQVTTALVVYT